jgi:hypothetical protein
MLFKNQVRAVYSYAVHGSVIAIIDHDEGRSITNDAVNIIDDLTRQGFGLTKYRVIYKDTSGIWDEILVDRTGRFAGFSSINERDLPAALARLPGIEETRTPPALSPPPPGRASAIRPACRSRRR